MNFSKKITVVLVDDCSTDKTMKLRKAKNNFKLIYIRNKLNKGLSITLETGFKKILKKLKIYHYTKQKESCCFHMKKTLYGKKYFKYRNIGKKITGIVLNFIKIAKIAEIKIPKKNVNTVKPSEM